MAAKAKAPACKCKKSECEECPEWIFTFADLVMLMMGFFVILWVLKPNPTPPATTSGPESKGAATAAAANQHWIDVEAAMRQAFGATGDPNSGDPVSVQLARRQLLTPAGEKDVGKSPVKAQGQTGLDQEVQSIRRAKTAVTGGPVMFARGEATLSPDLVKHVADLAVQVKGRTNIILVQGHTSLDDLPEGATAQQKFDLSIRRAQAVADQLTVDGVQSDVLRVVGCSTFEPVVAGEYTPNAQADNRRVEVQVTNMTTTEVGAARPTTAENGGR